MERRASRHQTVGFHLDWEDFPQAARFFAQGSINNGLRLHALPRLVWNPGFRCTDPVTGEPSVPCRKGFELRFHPTNLLGILWLQVAKRAEGVARDVRCDGCGGWITRGEGPGGRREQTRYHGSGCRTKATRARQARAQMK